MSKKEEISLDYLKSILDYNSETGIFLWKISHISRNIGKVAGYIQKMGYRSIGIGSASYYAHRLAWFYVYGYWPESLDHINGNKSDNRICNLRKATQSQNVANGRVKASSGLKGAYFNNLKKKWYSVISKEGNKMSLGYFASKEEAHMAYCKAASKVHGEFARFE